MSSILDTSELHEWLKNGFSKKEWKSISDPSCDESLKGKNHYGFKDKAMSEGSWVLDGILMPLKFADRILKDIRLSFA
ncbi:19533_t:CDS:2 [Gigaspora rosea]|nr:19533_t:CDS:2 [Gigaspora rosea]